MNKSTSLSLILAGLILAVIGVLTNGGSDNLEFTVPAGFMVLCGGLTIFIGLLGTTGRFERS
jgi:hypothetical protein